MALFSSEANASERNEKGYWKIILKIRAKRGREYPHITSHVKGKRGLMGLRTNGDGWGAGRGRWGLEETQNNPEKCVT